MKFVTCKWIGGSLCDFEAYGGSSSDVKQDMLDHIEIEHFGELMTENHLRSIEKKMDRILFYQD